MAHEFIAKNGIVSQGNIVISGSITTTGAITVSGSIASASYALSASYASSSTSASYAVSSSYALSSSYSLSSSYAANATSASYANNATTFNGLVSSVFATTGSNTFVGTQVLSGSVLQSGSFTTTGTIIAQTINVQTVTSSIVYSSGSNVFGNSLGNSQTFTGSVLITGSLTIAGASSATSYSGTTIYGSTAVCSAVGKFTSCIDAGSGTFSGQLNVSYASYPEQRITDGTIGYQMYSSTGASDFVLGTYTNHNLIFRTNQVQRLSISSTGAATFACSVQSNYLSSVINSSSNESPLILQNTAGWASSQISSITVKDGSSAVGAIGWKYDGVGNVDMLFHSLYNGAYKTTSDVVMTVKGTGNIGIGTTSPASKLSIGGDGYAGRAITAIANNADFGVTIRQDSASGAGLQIFTSQTSWGSTPLTIATSNTTLLSIASTGAATFSAATSAVTLTTNGAAGQWSTRVNGSSTAGSSYGLGVYAGINASDDSFRVHNYSGTEYFRVRGDGNVGIGSSSPNAPLDVTSTLSSSSGIQQWSYNSGPSSYRLQLNTLVCSGLVRYSFDMLNAGAASNCVLVFDRGNVGIGAIPFEKLSVKGDANNWTGNFIGSSTSGQSLGLLVTAGTTTADHAFLVQNATSSTTLLRIAGNGVACFAFTVCAPCFATISDYRMKSNIRPIEGLSIIMNTKPYKFEYNYDCSTSFGMIAHELQDALPEAVFGQKDGEVMQGVDYMKLLPITIKAIQEQQCTICSQASMINTLKTCLGIN